MGLLRILSTLSNTMVLAPVGQMLGQFVELLPARRRGLGEDERRGEQEWERVKEWGLAPNSIERSPEKTVAVRCLSPFFHIR